MTAGRLTKRPEYLRVAAAGRKWVAPGLILQARPRGGESGNAPDAESRIAPPRLGITVSRKVGNAVERNRAKRRLRAVAREVMPDEGQPGLDYVVIGRKATLSRPYPALVEDFRTAMRKMNRSWRTGGRPDARARREGKCDA